VDAAGVSSLLTTTEVTIVDLPKKDAAAPPPYQGDNSGMF
jgi:hypothetical protein